MGRGEGVRACLATTASTCASMSFPDTAWVGVHSGGVSISTEVSLFTLLQVLSALVTERWMHAGDSHGTMRGRLIISVMQRSQTIWLSMKNSVPAIDSDQMMQVTLTG